MRASPRERSTGGLHHLITRSGDGLQRAGLMDSCSNRQEKERGMMGGGVLDGDLSQREINASVGTLRNSRATWDQLQTELSPCFNSDGSGTFLIF
jgi:hypothetical protein